MSLLDDAITIEKKGALLSFVLTLLLFSFSEVITSAFFPFFFSGHFRPDLSLLILIFLCFRVDSPYVPVYLFIIRYLHSLFSLDHWSLGVGLGIIFHYLFWFLKDKIEFHSFLSTFFLNTLFITTWYGAYYFAFAFKIGDISFFNNKLSIMSLEILFLALLSLFIFPLLDKIWKSPKEHLNQ